MSAPTLDRARAALAMVIAPRTFATVARIESALAGLDASWMTDDEKTAVIEAAVKLSACGAMSHPDALIDVFAKIAAKGSVNSHDLHALSRAGITIHPETLARCEREARES